MPLLPDDIIRCILFHCDGVTTVNLLCAGSRVLAAVAERDIVKAFARRSQLLRSNIDRVPAAHVFLFATCCDSNVPQIRIDDCMIWACQRGHSATARYLLGLVPEPADLLYRSMYSASAHGNLETIKMLVGLGGNVLGLGHSALDSVCRNGYLAVLEYLHANGVLFTSSISMRLACEGGHLSTARFLVGAFPTLLDFPNRYLYVAASNGHLDIVQYLVDRTQSNRNLPAIDNCIEMACEGGHLETVEYLISLGGAYGDRCLDVAAAGGHTPIVQLLFSLGFVAPQAVGSCMRHACKGGHLETLKLAINMGVNAKQHLDSCLGSASAAGNLDVVEFIVKNGASSQAMKSAIRVARKNKNAAVIAFLKASGSDNNNCCKLG
ncbi:ankyrin repeat-containing domain protein [Geranomyces variabilis]|nr:ankyrin repeat-containing domain protein [Geranomyces variabilis]KAJ3135482.1 hypothetical protein HDU90_003884 [Geranomyces variabilis]